MLLLVADVIEVFGKVLNKVRILVYKPSGVTFFSNFNGFKCAEVVSLFIYLSLSNRVYWVSVTFKIFKNSTKQCLNQFGQTSPNILTCV